MSDELFYVRQVSPEHQSSQDYFEQTSFDDVILTGNTSYNDRGNLSLLTAVNDAAEDATNNFDEYYHDHYEDDCDIAELHQKAYEDTAAMLTKSYASKTHPQWTADEAKQLIDAYSEYVDKTFSRRLNERSPEEYQADMLSIYTGEKYGTQTLRGCSQSEWQQIYYPSEAYRDDLLGFIEAAYFNTGTEWIIHDEAEPPKTPEDINGCSFYCWTHNPREELAKYLDCKPDQLVMYEAEVAEHTVYREAVDNPDVKPSKAKKAEVER